MGHLQGCCPNRPDGTSKSRYPSLLERGRRRGRVWHCTHWHVVGTSPIVSASIASSTILTTQPSSPRTQLNSPSSGDSDVSINRDTHKNRSLDALDRSRRRRRLPNRIAPCLHGKSTSDMSSIIRVIPGITRFKEGPQDRHSFVESRPNSLMVRTQSAF